MWKNILAFNCIITWVKMLKHLGHVPVMTHIIKVMAHCLPGVLNFLFVFIFIFVGSAMAHLLAYGDSTYRFKDLPMSMYRYPPWACCFLQVFPHTCTNVNYAWLQHVSQPLR
jgi:hypothetical protein